MGKKEKKKWFKVLNKLEEKNKEMLRKNKITSNIYMLLNNLLHIKYNEVLKTKQND